MKIATVVFALDEKASSTYINERRIFLFITMEGTDGSGKSTQMEQLHRRLTEQGYDVLLTREPGGPPIAEMIRGVLLSPEHQAMEPMTEALLYAASRAQHVRETIRPALARGQVVLCDRFYDSSVAYQAFGRGLGLDVIERINAPAMDGLEPDRTYLLLVDEDTAKGRRAGQTDRIEGAGEDFYRRVRRGFEHIAKLPRVMAVNALLPIEEVAALIWADLRARLPCAN
jgi:dTMP kinase